MNEIMTPSLDLETIAPLASFDIEMHIRLHPYDHERLEPVYAVLDEEIRAFSPISVEDNALPFSGRVVQSYGAYLADHLEWTSRTLGDFLYHRGHEEFIVNKVVQAFKRHDIGKTLQPGLWKITEGKQNISEGQKRERAMHAELGAGHIRKTFRRRLGDCSRNESAGIGIAEHLALMHHERLNGSGPQKKTAADMCPILRSATIVDTFHGKLKAGKAADKIFDEMAGPKHEGEFDLPLLTKFREFYA
ncbi:MAG TPA: hypothetical protein VFS88_00035, partial [Micavibrio sp.]|nr:hypothetical protein [Micavibrio sp.]